jgi:type I restriction-modification system DNA methylase subunit
MKNDLFNQTLLRKYSKDFKLTLSKHELILKHIQKMDQGQFEAETKNYIYFYEVWLKDILGYDLDENVLVDEKEEHGRGKSEFILKSGDKKFMVVELKDQKTDLDKPQNRVNDKRTPVDQAFDYAQHTGDIDWILVSNYNEFRLYNWHKKGQYISFKVGELLDKTLLSYFLLSFSKKSHIETGYIDKLMDKTVVIERELEKEFYKLYNETRLMLIKEFEEINELSRLESIHYAQMIMNRYMFICFAEDIDLLPAQVSTDTILTPILKGNLRHGSIWQRLNELFLDIDEGNEYKKISQYNGGIFKEDLDHLKIRDIIEDQNFFKDVYQGWKFKEYEQDVNSNLGPYGQKVNPIYLNLLTISTFDFSTELDVNILGHIFENSIGDIEELKKASKGRRKKDGIFYTPDYITDYICRNTIIPYLSKSGKVNTVDELINEYPGSKIKELDMKVKEIKIIDPACGSGAFLNKAANVLLEIHESIREKLYSKGTLDHVWDPIEERREILLNNIYGVDLNEESVEITKLSLFLKVCRKGLILPNIENNIKCGNSLIDDSKYTDKPFKWETEFPNIFEEGGFDIVIGNPPYINVANLDNKERNYFTKVYESAIKRFDIYVLFIELGKKLLKNNGKLSYIIPYPFLNQKYAENMRKIILENYKINSIIDLSKFKIFPDAAVRNIILILEKEQNENNRNQNEFMAIMQNDDPNFTGINGLKTNIIQSSFYNTPENMFRLELNGIRASIIEKILLNSIKIGDIVLASWGARGVPVNKFHLDNKLNDFCKKMIKGTNIDRYSINYNNKWLLYDINKLYRPSFPKLFESEKLIIKKVTGRIGLIATYDNSKFYTDDSLCCCILKYNLKNEDSTILRKHKLHLSEDEVNLSKQYNLNYILAFINSKLLNFYFKIMLGYELNVYPESIEQLPIYPANQEQQKSFIENTDKMLQLNKELNDELNGFKGWLQHEPFNIDKFSKKLDKYHELSFDEFLLELNKNKVDTKQRKTQELLKNEFEESVNKINPLLQQIKETDNNIDKMVYDLYDLTPEEIKIIEDSLN